MIDDEIMYPPAHGVPFVSRLSPEGGARGDRTLQASSLSSLFVFLGKRLTLSESGMKD